MALTLAGGYAMLENAWRKNAEKDVAIEKAINEVNTQTIKNLNDWKESNQAVMMELASQLEAERKREDEERTEIDKLAETDEDVKKWRDAPLPTALRCVLNRKQGNKDCVAVP